MKAYSLDDTATQVAFNLATFYRLKGKRHLYQKYLAKAAADKNAPAFVLKELSEYYLYTKQFDQASAVFKRALGKGLDSAYVEQLMQRYPQLKR